VDADQAILTQRDILGTSVAFGMCLGPFASPPRLPTTSSQASLAALLRGWAPVALPTNWARVLLAEALCGLIGWVVRARAHVHLFARVARAARSVRAARAC